MTIRGELDRIDAELALLGGEDNYNALARATAAASAAMRAELDASSSPETWVSEPDADCEAEWGDECTRVFVDVEPGQGSPACCCGRDMKPAGRWRLIPDPEAE